MDNAPTEVSLASHPEMVKIRADHLIVFLFTIDNMDANKPVPVVKLPPVRFIGGTISQGITSIIQGSWDP